MHGDKCAQSMEAFSRFQRLLMCRVDSHPSMTCVRHGNRERYEARSGLDVTDCETNVFAPYVDDGSASTVIAGIHSKIILLMECGTQGKHPIWTLLVRATLVGPERRTRRCRKRRQHILMVGPAADCKSGRAFVSVLNVKDGDRREVRVYS